MAEHAGFFKFLAALCSGYAFYAWVWVAALHESKEGIIEYYFLSRLYFVLAITATCWWLGFLCVAAGFSVSDCVWAHLGFTLLAGLLYGAREFMAKAF